MIICFSGSQICIWFGFLPKISSFLNTTDIGISCISNLHFLFSSSLVWIECQPNWVSSSGNQTQGSRNLPAWDWSKLVIAELLLVVNDCIFVKKLKTKHLRPRLTAKDDVKWIDVRWYLNIIQQTAYKMFNKNIHCILVYQYLPYNSNLINSGVWWRGEALITYRSGGVIWSSRQNICYS